MTKRLLIVVAALLLVMMLVSAAAAQYRTDNRSPIGIRLAIFRPSDSTLRGIGSTWLGPMLDWNARFDRFDRPEVVVSVGWFGEDSNGEDASYFPLTASYIKRTGEAGTDNWYFGGGLGIYFVKYSRDFPFPQIDENTADLGFHVLGGREFGAWFGELRYDFGASAAGVDFDGFTLSVGTRLAF